MTLPTIIARHLIIEGRVQGVGFRYGVLTEAQQHQVVGWVRNCADGTVEAWLQGTPENVDALIQWCRRGPRTASVTGLAVSEQAIDETLSDFQVSRYR